ncbi:MAG: radical SAM protein [Candidatus Woesearchaeota archaeon]
MLPLQNENYYYKHITTLDECKLRAMLNENFKAIYVTDNYKVKYNILNNIGLKEDRDFYIIPNLDLIRLYVTNYCNAACSMCDIGLSNNKGIDRLRKSKGREMKIDFLDKILKYDYFKRNKVKFSLGMVEPLLHRKIGKFIRRITKDGHSVAVITNGLLLEDKADEIVSSGTDYVMVSLDGPERIHNKIRGIKGIYSKAIKGIEKIKEIDSEFRVVINYAISNLNYNYLYEFIQEIEKKTNKCRGKVSIFIFCF